MKRSIDGGKVDIKKLDASDFNSYDELVDESLEGSIFHKTWWLNIFREYYGSSYNVDFYGIFENNRLIAGMPVPINHKYGMRFIHNPRLTPYSGPFFAKIDMKKPSKISHKKEINALFAETLKRNGLVLHYSFYHNNTDLQPYIWNGFDVEVFYTYILEISELNNVWQNMDRKRRNDINKFSKQNYDIKYGSISHFIELNRNSMNRQSHEIYNEKIWTTIFNECKKNNCCEVFSVLIDNEPISSLFLVWDNKMAYYIGGGISNNSQGAMSFLIWEAIKYTKEKLKLYNFDFEGSSVQSIELFFRKFGGNITPMLTIRDNSIKEFIIRKAYSYIK